MNTIRRKMRPEFQGLQGGLFSSVKKADVGTAVLDLMANGVDMLCWACAGQILFSPTPFCRNISLKQ